MTHLLLGHVLFIFPDLEYKGAKVRIIRQISQREKVEIHIPMTTAE